MQALVAPGGVTRHVKYEWLLYVADNFVLHLRGSDGFFTERADLARRAVSGSHALNDASWKTPAVQLLPGASAKVGVRRIRPGGHRIRSPKVEVLHCIFAPGKTHGEDYRRHKHHLHSALGQRTVKVKPATAAGDT